MFVVKDADTDVIMSAVLAVVAMLQKASLVVCGSVICLTDSNPFACWPAGLIERDIFYIYLISSRLM